MRKTNTPADPNALRAMGYDPEIVPVRTIALVLVGLLVFLIFSIALGVGIYNVMVPNEYRVVGRGPEPPALHRIPPHPQLQTYPKDEMHDYWAVDHAKINQYGLANLQDASRETFGSANYPGSMKWGGETASAPAMPESTPEPVAISATPAPAAKPTAAPAIAPVQLATPAATPAPEQVKAAQEKLTQEMTLQNIEFETASATIRPASTKILDDVATTLKQVAGTSVEIGGHTDSRGSEAINLKLSQDRADAVKTYLVGKGISASQLTAKGFGASKPVADNATPDGQQKNRRIEFTLKK
jgi:outer membrane protein OmpA-like peptidoglycan-associated protein